MKWMRSMPADLRAMNGRHRGRANRRAPATRKRPNRPRDCTPLSGRARPSASTPAQASRAVGIRRRALPAPGHAPGAPIHAEGPEREVLGVQVILEIEDAREPGAVPERVVPGAVRRSGSRQVADAALHRAALGTARREQAEERPRGLARDRLAAPGQLGVVVRGRGSRPSRRRRSAASRASATARRT